MRIRRDKAGGGRRLPRDPSRERGTRRNHGGARKRRRTAAITGAIVCLLWPGSSAQSQSAPMLPLEGGGRARRAPSTAPKPQQTLNLVHLRWHRRPGAEACLGPHELEAAVEGRLQRRVFVPRSRATALIEGWIEPARLGPGWRVELTLRSPEGRTLGRRRLDSETGRCRGLDDSLGLVLALMVDAARPQLRLRLPRRKLLPPPQQAQGAPPTTGAELTAGLGLHSTLGLLPGAALGLSLGATLRRRRTWAAGLRLTAWQTSRAAALNVSLDVSGWQLETKPCWTPLAAASLQYDLCASLAVGRLHAGSPRGLDQARSPTAWLVYVAPAMRLSLEPVRHLILSLSVSAAVPLLRTRFYFVHWQQGVGTPRTLWRAWPVAPLLGIALGLRLP